MFALDTIKRHIDERLPEEYEKGLVVGLNAIIKEAWNTAQNTEDKKEKKIKAFSLAKECYSMKLDLLTNATVVDDTTRFVSQRSKDKIKPSSNNSNSDEDNNNIKNQTSLTIMRMKMC